MVRRLAICPILEKPCLPFGDETIAFEVEPGVGLSTSSLTQEIINYIQDEGDLRKIIEGDCNVNMKEGMDGWLTKAKMILETTLKLFFRQMTKVFTKLAPNTVYFKNYIADFVFPHFI